MEQKPSLGRIVIYKLTSYQKPASPQHSHESALVPNNGADECPAVIVRVWSDTCVNLRLLNDGRGDAPWVTSATIGDGEGQWNWPARK